MKKSAIESFDFEKSMQQLTKMVEEMEKGQLTLEQSLEHFEKGVNLVKQCQQALTAAEQKVQILTGERENAELTTYTELTINELDSKE